MAQIALTGLTASGWKDAKPFQQHDQDKAKAENNSQEVRSQETLRRSEPLPVSDLTFPDTDNMRAC